MAIITISRGSYSMGKHVAEKVAEKLNYTIISREVLLDASSQFNIPEIKLEKAIHDAPGILDRYRHTKQTYLACIGASLIERACDDNIIYHGLAGHLLLKGIQHVLKVRITARMETRIAAVIQRDNISAEEARERILEDDRQRRKWTKNLYGEDPWDSSLYDLTIRVEHLSIDNAVEFICQAAASPGFATTPQSRQKIKDLAIATRVKASLVQDFPDIGVTSDYGNILIYVNKEQSSTKISKRLPNIRNHVAGIHNMEVHTGISFPEDAV